ncbi:MAG: M56 family metallopeptidase [Eubacteriales bacterium]|nr:M56 family metallopeptidase [Eubacteriales bacterium]
MSLVQMSFSGAVMILTVVVIRALALHKLPKKTFWVLWEVVLVRLMVPYSIPCALSVYSLVGRLTHTADETQVIPVISALPVLPPKSATPGRAVFASDPGVIAFDPWTAVWLTGVLGFGIFFAVAYFKCRREFRASLPVGNDYVKGWLQSHQPRRPVAIRQSDRISAPLTYGVFRPVILMPKTADWTDKETLDYVLGHEYEHIRRFDAVTKLVLTSALCVHWFNPMVWIMYILANRDIELSCDEAVIRRFGERTKSAYAMTLIRMEETRSGLSPLCNNFSKNAIEERIVAIMKTKKTSLVALIVAIGLIAGVTTTFATSAQAAETRYTGKNVTANIVQTAMDGYTVTSYTDPVNGKTYYSMDGGKTWTPITDEEFNAASGWDDVEWWTAEEYAAWLEQEKIDLQAIIGSQGWTPSTGWFTWTQEMVDETIAKYEQTLKDIQDGQKISKLTADGDTMIQFGYDPSLQVTTTDATTDTTAVLGSVAMMDSITDDTVVPGSQTLTAELLTAYKTHGLTYDEANGAFYFNGKLVRYFFDGYTLENGVATIYDHVNKDGVVDVHTIRQATQNADGSMDPGGKLVGIEEYSQEEFDSRLIMTPAMTQETASTGFVGSTGGVTFEDRFARYKDFGITYVEARNASGKGNVYLNGQLVSRFSDVSPDGSAFSFTSAEKGGIAVQTVYDSNGQLSGVETVRE